MTKPVEPCECGHGKREHEGQTGACTLCGCKEYVVPDDGSEEELSGKHEED